MDDVAGIVEFARKQGAKIVQELREDGDGFGTVKTASIQTVGCHWKGTAG